MLDKPANFLEFRLQAVDIQSEWERCSLLANYVGQSAAFEFSQSEYAENIIATVVNEILEMIANLATADSGLSIDVDPRNGELSIAVCFVCRAELQSEFRALIGDVKENSQSIYFDLLTQTEEPVQSFNQLGVAMLIHDFGAMMTVEQDANNFNNTCVRIQIPKQEFVI
jgi:hypothetical protein